MSSGSDFELNGSVNIKGADELRALTTDLKNLLDVLDKDSAAFKVAEKTADKLRVVVTDLNEAFKEVPTDAYEELSARQKAAASTAQELKTQVDYLTQAYEACVAAQDDVGADQIHQHLTALTAEYQSAYKEAQSLSGSMGAMARKGEKFKEITADVSACEDVIEDINVDLAETIAKIFEMQKAGVVNEEVYEAAKVYRAARDAMKSEKPNEGTERYEALKTVMNESSKVLSDYNKELKRTGESQARAAQRAKEEAEARQASAVEAGKYNSYMEWAAQVLDAADKDFENLNKEIAENQKLLSSSTELLGIIDYLTELEKTVSYVNKRIHEQNDVWTESTSILYEHKSALNATYENLRLIAEGSLSNKIQELKQSLTFDNLSPTELQKLQDTLNTIIGYGKEGLKVAVGEDKDVIAEKVKHYEELATWVGKYFESMSDVTREEFQMKIGLHENVDEITKIADTALDLDNTISKLQAQQRKFLKASKTSDLTEEEAEQYSRNKLLLEALKLKRKQVNDEYKAAAKAYVEQANASREAEAAEAKSAEEMEKVASVHQRLSDGLKEYVDTAKEQSEVSGENAYVEKQNAVLAEELAKHKEAQAKATEEVATATEEQSVKLNEGETSERQYAAGLLGIIQEMRALKEEQKTLGASDSTELADASRYDYIIQRLAELTQAKKDYEAKLTGVVEEEKAYKETVDESADATDRKSKAITKATKSSKGFQDATKKVQKTMKKGLMAITKYVLGFRSLFFLVRKLKSVVKEGLENLVQFDSSNNETNKAISDLRSELLFLKNAWAAAVAPVLNVVIPVLNTLINAFARVGNAVGMFFGKLRGDTQVIQAVKADMGDYAKSLDKSAGSSGKASKAADKLKDRLAAFDDLNVLGKDDETDPNSSTGGGGGNPTDMPSVDEMFKWEVPENAFADKILDALQANDFTEVGRYLGEKIKSAFDNIDWDAIRKQMNEKIHWITSFLNGLFTTPDLFGTLGRNLAEAINTGIMGVRKFIREFKWKDVFKNVGKGITDFFKTLDIAQILATVVDGARAIMQAITGFLEGADFGEILTSIVGGIAEFLMTYDWKGLLADVGELVGAIFKVVFDIGKWLWDVMYEGVNGLADAIGEAVRPNLEALGEDATWLDVGWAIVSGLLEGAYKAIKNIASWLYDNIFKPIYDGICDAFDIHSPSRVMEDIGINIIEGLLNGITSMIDLVKTPFVNLKDKIIELWGGVKTKASEVWGSIKNIITNFALSIKNGVVEKFELIKTKLTESVTALKDSIVNIWEGIWTAIKGVINNILGGVEGFVNGMIGGINKLIAALNSLNITLPEGFQTVAKEVFGKEIGSLGFNIPSLNTISIPRLAQGAVIPPNKEFMAVLGDQKQGTNVEAPLETIKQALADVMGNIQVENTGNAVMELDGQVFARLLVPYVVSELDRRGYNTQIITAGGSV